MKRKLMVILGLLVIASMLLSACATAPAAAPAAEQPAGEATAAEEQPSSGLGDLPRNETLIADILTGRVGTPSNFNEWVGWKWRDRGMQNLANEPLWSVDFATGEIINGLADGDPDYNEDFTGVDDSAAPGCGLVRRRAVHLGRRRLHGRNADEDSKASTPTASLSTTSSPCRRLTTTRSAFELNKPNSRFHTTFLDRWGAHLDHAQAHLGNRGRSDHFRVQPVCRHRPLQAAQL